MTVLRAVLIEGLLIYISRLFFASVKFPNFGNVPLLNFQTLEMFPVFPVFLGKKKESLEKSCSIRTALTPPHLSMECWCRTLCLWILLWILKTYQGMP